MYYETVFWDCNLWAQQKLSSVGVLLCTVACYEHHLLLLGNQTKQQRISARSWARTFWFGGGEGKKETCHNPRESSSLPSATLPQLLKGQSRVISQKQAHPWSCSFHNKSSQNTRALLCPKSYEMVRGAEFLSLRMLKCRRAEWWLLACTVTRVSQNILSFSGVVGLCAAWQRRLSTKRRRRRRCSLLFVHPDWWWWFCLNQSVDWIYSILFSRLFYSHTRKRQTIHFYGYSLVNLLPLGV